MTVRPSDPQLAVSIHQPTHANERHSDHVSLLIEFDRVALRRRVVVGCTTLVSLDVEVEHVATIVVLVVGELDAGDEDWLHYLVPVKEPANDGQAPSARYSPSGRRR